MTAREALERVILKIDQAFDLADDGLVRAGLLEARCIAVDLLATLPEEAAPARCPTCSSPTPAVRYYVGATTEKLLHCLNTWHDASAPVGEPTLKESWHVFVTEGNTIQVRDEAGRVIAVVDSLAHAKIIVASLAPEGGQEVR